MYAVKYRLEFLDEYDRWVRVDLLQEGYEGETISERAGEGFSPLHISIQNQGDEKFETIKATEIDLSIFSDNFELEEISEASDTEFLMKVYEAPTEDGALSLKHIGYVIPEIYTEPYVVEPYSVTIRAASIGLLNNIRYVTDEYGEFFTGEATLMTILTRCLNKLDYEIDIWDSINTFEDRILYFDTSPLEEIKIDQAAFLFEENDRQRAKTCMEVIEQILKPFVVNFFMDYGRWVIIPMELRGTNREVRIFDYEGTTKSTGIYNPLNRNYNWINQDQILEFMPLARDVESLYEHGFPNDIVENHKFDGEFIEVSKSVGSIWYPDGWSLNDVDDFDTIEVGATSTQIYSGIRFIADGQSDGRSFSTFFHSALVEDGAYIEQTGTRIIKAGEDSVRFLIDYSGVVKLWSGDLSLNDTAVPEDSIDHKFQIKIGSKYLTDQGSWTGTPTDIILNDLGDGGWRYPTSNVNIVTGEIRSGFATNFRQFEIVSDPIEEEGTAYVRIYKPVSENEGPGPGGGDTYCTVAYSEFSLLLNPGGESPTESTLFFGERNVETYADDFEFTLESGDGPTNFHVSSFLIDTEYGNNLKTENWVRGNLEGGISEVAINAIFLEYDTKSNLIRGTQKVRGLFDRWFIEFQKGYTVLAGIYDQRLCRFNGEMVQILNAEVDVWGEELEPPENFQVLLNPGPLGPDDFDDELFYISDRQANDENYVHKCTGNIADGITIHETWQFPTEAELPGIVNAVNRGHNIAVLRNGNVIVHVSSGGIYPNGFVKLWLFDENLNEIRSIQFNLFGFPYQNLPFLAVDYDDSVYFNHAYETASDARIVVKKWNADLTQEMWETETYSDQSSDQIMALQATKNYVINIYKHSGTVRTGKVFQKVTGDLEKTLSKPFFSQGVNVKNYLDGSFFIGGTDDSGDHFISKYDENADQISEHQFTQSVTFARDACDTNEDGSLVTRSSGSGTILRHYDLDFNQIWGQILGPNPLAKVGRTTDPNIILMHDQDQSNPEGELWHVNLATQTPTLIDPYGAADINPLRPGAFAMKVENWQVQAPGDFDPGTPEIQNAFITADPDTATVPFNSSIDFGAENTGDANVTLNLTKDGVVISSLEIPAGGANSDTYNDGFPEPGSFVYAFAGQSVTVTANGNSVTGDYEGYVEITSPATDDTEEEQPEGFVDVINVPSQSSDPCENPGTHFNVEWKLTDYCLGFPDGPDKSIVAAAVSGQISSQVTGLGSATSGLSPSGFPRIRVYSETFGVADNGESVTFGVPSSLEQNGGVFSRYEVFLQGGVDEYIVNEQIDILIGGAVFATTSAITALETADSIAQKIYNACVAVGDPDYSFAKNGTRVTVGSTDGEETFNLDIKNAGFAYTKQNIEEVS